MYTFTLTERNCNVFSVFLETVNMIERQYVGAGAFVPPENQTLFTPPNYLSYSIKIYSQLFKYRILFKINNSYLLLLPQYQIQLLWIHGLHDYN